MVMFNVYHFFAGGGFVELAMKPPTFNTSYVNDFDKLKLKVYRHNFDTSLVDDRDVNTVQTSDLPGLVDIVWSSFPCTDISLAGGRAGLSGSSSSAFFPFHDLMLKLVLEKRAPKVIILENVDALMTSNNGEDRRTVMNAFSMIGYAVSVIRLDAKHFVPQHRKRMFFLMWRPEYEFCHGHEDVYPVIEPENSLANTWQETDWISGMVPDDAKIIETSVEQFSSKCNNMPVLTENPGRWYPAYRRTRTIGGVKSVRYEVATDGMLGCLRRAEGGSSLPKLIRYQDGVIQETSLPVEVAKTAMGIGEQYPYAFNCSNTQAFNIMGDAVVPQCVDYIMNRYVLPTLSK